MYKFVMQLFVLCIFVINSYATEFTSQLELSNFYIEWNGYLDENNANRSSIGTEDYRITEFALIENWGVKQYPRRRESIPGIDDRDIRWVPYLENKVMLQDGTEMSASYIRLNWSENDLYHNFIASHAPLENNVDLFWQMAWENKIDQIVMVTELTDNGTKQLCYPYWPEASEKILVLNNGMTIELVNEKWLLPDHIENIQIRKFLVSFGDEQRLITHYWYHNWPDNTAPLQTTTLYALIQEVVGDKEKLKTNTPILAHCAAGVGRTGSFITGYHLYQRVEQELPLPSLFEFIAQLRWQRPKMVAKFDQYNFCYKIWSELHDYSILKLIKKHQFSS